MNNEDKTVKCVECGYVHAWSTRTESYDPEYNWTCSYCPKCGEESYYPIDKDQSINNENTDNNERFKK